jgi:HipA-like protein
MTNQLIVYLNSTKAGVLERDGRLLTFSYSADYLALPGASPISRLLPLAPTVYGDDATRAFFSNLLPEGAVLTHTLGKFATEIGIDIRIVKSAFIKMMGSIETQSTQLFDKYRDNFGNLVILGEIARVIDYRIAKGRELVQ